MYKAGKEKENLKDVTLAQTNVKMFPFQQSTAYNKSIVAMGCVF